MVKEGSETVEVEERGEIRGVLSVDGRCIVHGVFMLFLFLCCE